jgi:hypothetical protein
MFPKTTREMIRLLGKKLKICKFFSVIAIMMAFAITLAHKSFAQNYQPTQGHSNFSVRGANFGSSMAADGDRIAIQSTIGDGIYIYVRNIQGNWIREQRIAQYEITTGGIDLEGNRLAIGQPFAKVAGKSEVGRVQIYERGSSGWQLTTTISAPDSGEPSRFGSSLDLRGDLLLVGAPRAPTLTPSSNGKAHVFGRIVNGDWELRSTLTPINGAPGQRFGYQVRFAGDQVVASARYASVQNNNRGALYVFDQIGAGWQQSQLFLSTGFLAQEFAVFGDVLVAQNGSTGLRIFSRTGGIWADSSGITTAAGYATNAGLKIALDGNGVIWSETDFNSVRIRYASRNGLNFATPLDVMPTFAGTNAGAAQNSSQLFVGNPSASFGLSRGQGEAIALDRQDTNFPEQKRFRAGDGNIGASFGSVVDVDESVFPASPLASRRTGDTAIESRLMVTAPFEDGLTGAPDEGTARIYQRFGTDWTLEALLRPTVASPLLGMGQTGLLCGNYAVLGAPDANHGDGQVLIYRFANGSWNPTCVVSPVLLNARFGTSIALGGAVLAIQEVSPNLSSEIRLFQLNIPGCPELPTLRHQVNGRPDTRLGTYMAIEGNVLVASGKSSIPNADNSCALAYDLTILPSPPVELNFPTNPAIGVLSGFYVTGIDLQADRLVVQNIGSRQAPMMGGVSVLLNWLRTASGFVAAPAVIEEADDISLSENMTALAINDPISAHALIFGSSAFINPAVVPIPNSENVLTDISLSTTSLAVGQGHFDTLNISQIGRVVLFNRDTSGGWISAGKIELASEQVFSDNFEDVP